MALILILLAFLAVPAWADNCANLPAPTTLAWNGLEKTPGMGWSPGWGFEGNVTESIIKAQADLMVSDGFLAAGYNIVSISDWWAQRSGGLLIANPATFPDGMAATVTYIHNDGLLAGLYSSPYTTTCAGDAGSGTFEATDANTFASWGADYLWYDGCNVPSLYTSCWGTSYQLPWQMMAQDIRATGRPMILHMGSNYGPASQSIYDMQQQVTWAKSAGYNEVYVMNTDLPANGGTGWATLRDTLDPIARGFYKWEQPGYFPMCDGLLNTAEATGVATFNDGQSQTQMGLYALWGCPLYLNMDLSTLDATAIAFYKNAGIIAVDQDPLAHAAILYQIFPCGSANCEIWVKPLTGNKWAIGLVNFDTSSHAIGVNFSPFGGDPDVYDLEASTDLGNMTSYTTTVPACSATAACISMVKVTPAAGAAHTITNAQLENMAIQ